MLPIKKKKNIFLICIHPYTTYVQVPSATCDLLTFKGWIASSTQPKENTCIPFNLVLIICIWTVNASCAVCYKFEILIVFKMLCLWKLQYKHVI